MDLVFPVPLVTRTDSSLLKEGYVELSIGVKPVEFEFVRFPVGPEEICEAGLERK
jgi:hypothetical protein